MRRLVTRLTLSMLALAVLTAFIMVVSIQVGVDWYLRSLPADLRERVMSQFDGPNDISKGVDNATLVGTLLAGVVAAVFARVLARMLAGPIEEVSRASMRVAQGDLSVRLPEAAKLPGLELEVLTHNFNEMADALQTYERERRDMIASIAHDLRTPLSAMQIRLELLKEHVVPYSEAEVDLLLGQLQLLGRLVNDLRTLSLADAGKLSLDLQRLELGGATETILTNYAHFTGETSVGLLFHPPEDAIWVDGDAQRLTQVLGNLLDNAFRATPSGGAVRVRLQRDDGGIALSVEDEGPGIPDDLLPRLFDRFVQGKDKTGSSGLGLAIVKTLVNLHGGTVSATNRPEGGARFTVTLPARRAGGVTPTRVSL